MAESLISALPTASVHQSAVQVQKLWHPLWFALISALGMTLLLNGPFLSSIQAKVPGQFKLQLSLILLLFLLNFLLSVLASFRAIQKPVMLLLFAAGAVSYHFITSFGIVIDTSMLQNAMETDAAEARGLLSITMLWTVSTLMLFPLLCSSLIKVRVMPLRQFLLHWLFCLVLIFVALFSLAASAYSDLAPFFRNFRDIKHLALPVSPVSAAVSFSGSWLNSRFPEQFIQLGTDAVQPVAAKTAKPRLVVLVLGETARADHFQLNGYHRATNPGLSALPLYSFRDVSSCGTATAHSVPCMFSAMGRDKYVESVAKNSSNVLDILKRSGIAVSWFDNNSGCKTVCDRVPSEFLFNDSTNPLCKDGQCQDEILVQALQAQLTKQYSSDRLIVLHQLGSHGPEYFKRSSDSQKHFLPECTNKQLQLCQQAEIINAYDNSIVATDELLSRIIQTLQGQQDYQTAMLYLSDHGESLGENGVYLHGLPYLMAPDAQTKVPMLWWMSDTYASTQQLKAECMAQRTTQKLSHDNLFHSLLGIFQISSKIHRQSLDVFRPC
ncbi:phosphoethanolamine--lipid A transferase [uncultured Rheinheimera sp.]|uniref:phosphoethanolamine transferase n=1 Tax=uncultured Rheinheimera sp. TaxID=400532 RepID=UPI002593558C|nr:phosphoethanolamine--lipid A transferase [uncultured Rheinheimera sp.]